MPVRSPVKPNRSLAPFIVGIVAVLIAIAAFVYLSRPPKPEPGQTTVGPEVRAYLAHLALSDVKMLASENFMRQQVIEVTGNIQNTGPKSLKSVEVYCLFYGVDGQEIHRERLPIVGAQSSPLKPGETRPFRLPFDTLPDGWNQTLPKMVIAQITFAG